MNDKDFLKVHEFLRFDQRPGNAHEDKVNEYHIFLLDDSSAMTEKTEFDATGEDAKRLAFRIFEKMLKEIVNEDPDAYSGFQVYTYNDANSKKLDFGLKYDEYVISSLDKKGNKSAKKQDCSADLKYLFRDDTWSCKSEHQGTLVDAVYRLICLNADFQKFRDKVGKNTINVTVITCGKNYLNAKGDHDRAELIEREIESYSVQDTSIRVHAVVLSETGYPDLQKVFNHYDKNKNDDDNDVHDDGITLYPDFPFTNDKVLQIRPNLKHVVRIDMLGSSGSKEKAILNHFLGKETNFYPGKICRDRGDRTYDVEYDNPLLLEVSLFLDRYFSLKDPKKYSKKYLENIESVAVDLIDSLPKDNRQEGDTILTKLARYKVIAEDNKEVLMALLVFAFIFTPRKQTQLYYLEWTYWLHFLVFFFANILIFVAIKDRMIEKAMVEKSAITSPLSIV